MQGLGSRARCKRFLPKLSIALLFGLLLAVSLAPADADAASGIMSLPRSWTATGGLDPIIKRREVRLLVPFSKTQFFADGARIYGVTAERGRELETELNQRYGGKNKKPIRVVFVPTRRDRLLAELIAGHGDIAAGFLTITPERAALVDFVDPWRTNVKEVVVTGPSSPILSILEDLSDKEIRVRKSSSYFTHLTALSNSFVTRGFAPIQLRPITENLEDEDLMEMVNAGLLPYVIVDDFKAKIWTTIFTKLTVREDLAVNSGGSIAWAIRKNSPLLRAELNRFVAANKIGTEFGDIINVRYFKDNKILREAYAPEDVARFNALFTIFKRYGDQYAIEPTLLTAQGYQESQLDQTKRSPFGAVGIMQLLTSTAREVGVAGVDKDPEANIHAGAAYMRRLADAYVNDPKVDATNRVLMTFAAYNAGPGSLLKCRLQATREGFNPNIWFDNVEDEVAKTVGAETVIYVGNIYKYYVGYSLLLERQAAEEAAKRQLDYLGIQR
jgi:membrane-bound lytic murein transglycosylase MltF